MTTTSVENTIIIVIKFTVNCRTDENGTRIKIVCDEINWNRADKKKILHAKKWRCGPGAINCKMKLIGENEQKTNVDVKLWLASVGKNESINTNLCKRERHCC